MPLIINEILEDTVINPVWTCVVLCEGVDDSMPVMVGHYPSIKV